MMKQCWKKDELSQEHQLYFLRLPTRKDFVEMMELVEQKDVLYTQDIIRNGASHRFIVSSQVSTKKNLKAIFCRSFG